MTSSNQAVGYCRISTDKQSGSDHYSLALQSEILKKMAVQHQTVLAAIFTDIASGSKDHRNGLSQLELAIERRPNVRFLFVYRLNRLARNLQLLLGVFELCQKNNVRIISYMEPTITDTASGRLQLSMFGAVAQFERSLTLENQAQEKPEDVLTQNVDQLLQLVAAIISEQATKTLKAIYQVFIESVTFDRRKKLVWVHMRFDDEVITSLKQYEKETSKTVVPFLHGDRAIKFSI